MSEELRSKPDQPFKIGDLVRLNDELKQLREALRAKKAEREKARREGKKLRVDLTPEIERLSQFLVDLEIISSKLRSTSTSAATGKTSTDNALNAALAQVKAEIENEKKKLEQESAARREEQRRHEEELKLLRDELAKSKEVAEAEREPAQSLLNAELQPAEKAATTAEKNLFPQPPAPVAAEVPANKPSEERLDIEGVRRSIESRVADEFSVIRTEVQMLREQILRQQDSLEARRKELEEERRRVEDQKRALESQVADQFSATRSELQRLREQVAREQEQLEDKRRELVEEKRRIDEEKRILDRRIDDSEEQRLRRLTRRATEELQGERVELSVLKRSLQQLRSESTRDRRRLERDREAIRKARVSLEIERRRIDLRNAILQMKSKSEQGISQGKKSPRELSKNEPEPSAFARVEGGAEAVSPVDQTISEEAIVLGIRLGDGDYGIDISRVREIMTKRPITPLPRQPAYVEGVINIRGSVMPVINLRKRFDIAGEVPKNPNIVILESSQGVVAILVDSVSEVIRVPQDKIHPAPSIAHGMEGEYLKGICQVGTQLLLYLDVDKILRKATPIPSLYSGSGFGAMVSPNISLIREEQRILKAIPVSGGGKTQLMRRARVGSTRFDKAISSLSRKGLISVNRVGKKRIIMRTTRQKK